MKTFTRVQNEKLIAVQKDIAGSIVDKIDKLFEKAYAVTMRTEGVNTYISFDIQEDSGLVRRQNIRIDSDFFTVEE